MKQPNIVQRFFAMTEDLKNNPAITVTKCEFNSPATKAELRKGRKKLALTQTMIDFYGQVNGVAIEWERHLPDEEYRVIGRIRLLPIQSVLGDWKDSIYFSDEDEFKPLHPLDYFVDEACAALYIEDKESDPQVFYHYLGEEMSPLGVNFDGYLELLLKSRGFWYWQKAIAAPEYVNPYVPTSREEDDFRTIMPKLFPYFNDSEFKRFN